MKIYGEKTKLYLTLNGLVIMFLILYIIYKQMFTKFYYRTTNIMLLYVDIICYKLKCVEKQVNKNTINKKRG